MAINGFGRSKGDDEMMSASVVGSGSADLTAFIDQGSEFEGKLTFKDTVRIDGNFHGEITSENTLIVGETGYVEATIRSNTVVVSGNVVGNIKASRQLVLRKTARIEGDVNAPSLVIEEGATLNGGLTMTRTDAGDAKGTSSGSLQSIPGGAKKEDAQASRPTP